MGKTPEEKAAKLAKKAAKEAAEVPTPEPKKEKKDKKRKAEEEAEAPVVDEKAAKKAAKKAKAAAEEAAEAAAVEEKAAKKAAKKAKAAAEEAATEAAKKPAAKESSSSSDDSDSDEEEEEKVVIKTPAAVAAPAAAPAAAAPDGITKCFVANLAWAIDDDTLKGFLAGITEINWMSDKETGRFKGCGFAEFESPEACAAAVAMAGTEILGRELKIEFANKPSGGAERKPRVDFATAELKAKPAGCNTVFMGNLSYEIDDDQTYAFFKDVGAVEKIKWLTDRESGEFKGCGFVTFESADSVDEAVKLRGSYLLGRPVKMDYAEPPKPREAW